MKAPPPVRLCSIHLGDQGCVIAADDFVMEWLSKRQIEVGAKVEYRGRMWRVHVASAFPFAPHYRAVCG